MDMSEPVTIYTVSNPYEAEIIKVALLGQGIPCMIDGERQAGLSDILTIGILVPAKDADLARDIIEESEAAKQHAAAAKSDDVEYHLPE
jgi:hypothetical protein